MTANPHTDQLAAYLAQHSAEHDATCDCEEKAVAEDIGRLLMAELPGVDAITAGQVILHLSKMLSAFAHDQLQQRGIAPAEAEVLSAHVNVMARTGHLLYVGGPS